MGSRGFKLVTKLPAIPDGSVDLRGWVQEQYAVSVAWLGVSRVYGLLLHCSAQLDGKDGNVLYQALKGLPVLTPRQQANRYFGYHLYVNRLKLGETKMMQKQFYTALHAAGIGINVHYIPVLQPGLLSTDGLQCWVLSAGGTVLFRGHQHIYLFVVDYRPIRLCCQTLWVVLVE